MTETDGNDMTRNTDTARAHSDSDGFDPSTAEFNFVRQTPVATALDHFIYASRFGDPQERKKGREQVETEKRKEIEDAYVALHAHAGAVLLRNSSGRRRKYSTNLAYRGTAALVDPKFDTVLWRALAIERDAGYRLRGQPRRTAIIRTFGIVVFMLSFLDVLHDNRLTDSSERIDRAVNEATSQLDDIERGVTEQSKRIAVSDYLLGLVPGFLVCALLVFLASHYLLLPPTPPLDALQTTQLLATCLAAGAIGAIVSVMTRVNRGQGVEIDIRQGAAVRVVAGGFRPIIGSVFGAALFVLISGGLIPLAIPEGGPLNGIYFFGGLAFLGGFSERWAQDVIVQSNPESPGPGR